MTKHGIKHLLHSDWATKEIMDVCRATEIHEWLSRHEEVENFGILDDQSIYERNSPDHVQYLKKHVVTPDRDNGILLVHQAELIDILNDES
jgi:hypothetical protein